MDIRIDPVQARKVRPRGLTGKTLGAMGKLKALDRIGDWRRKEHPAHRSLSATWRLSGKAY